MTFCFADTALVLLSSANTWAELKTKTIEYKQGSTVLEGCLAYNDAIEVKRTFTK